MSLPFAEQLRYRWRYVVAGGVGTFPIGVIGALERIPGVRVWKRGYGAGTIDVPQHAAWIVAPVLQAVGVPIAQVIPPAAGLVGQNRPQAQDVIDRLIETGTLRPEYRAFATPYQLDWISTALDPALPGALAEWPTGSGKSFGVLVAGLAVPGTLVIVTEAKVRDQWARQVRRFTTLDPFVCKPESTLRKGALRLDVYLSNQEAAGRRCVLVLAWESLPDWIARIETLLNIGAVVGDEIHSIKSAKRKKMIPDPDAPDEKRFEDLDNRATAADRLRAVAKKAFAASATTKFDRMKDYWSVLNWLDPDAWGGFARCGDRYFDRKPGTFGGFDVKGATNVREFNARLSFVRHVVSDAEARRMMPPLREQSVYVSIEDQAASSGYAAELKAAAKRGHTALLEARLAEAAALKRPVVLGYVADHVEAGHKILIFVERKELCERLAADIAKKHNGVPVFCVHGDKHSAAITDALAEFNGDPERGLEPCAGPAVLVATGQKLGTGLDMPTVDVSMFVQLAWNDSQIKQRRGRGHRLGGSGLLVYYFIAEGTVDEHVVDINIEKIDQGEGVVSPDSGMRNALSGADNPEALAKSINAKLDGIDASLLED